MRWEDVPKDEIERHFNERNGDLQQMRGFFSLLKDTAVTVKDRTGRILWANHAAELMFNMPLAQFRGESIQFALGPNAWPKARKELAKVFRSEMVEFEFQHGQSYSAIRIPFRDDQGDMLVAVLRVRTGSAV